MKKYEEGYKAGASEASGLVHNVDICTVKFRLRSAVGHGDFRCIIDTDKWDEQGTCIRVQTKILNSNIYPRQND